MLNTKNKRTLIQEIMDRLPDSVVHSVMEYLPTGAGNALSRVSKHVSAAATNATAREQWLVRSGREPAHMTHAEYVSYAEWVVDYDSENLGLGRMAIFKDGRLVNNFTGAPCPYSRQTTPRGLLHETLLNTLANPKREEFTCIVLYADISQLPEDTTSKTMGEWISSEAKPGMFSTVYDAGVEMLYPKAAADYIRASLYKAAHAAAAPDPSRARDRAIADVEYFASRDLYPLNAECVEKHLRGVPVSVLKILFTYTRGAMGMFYYECDLSAAFKTLASSGMFGAIAALCQAFQQHRRVIDAAVRSLDPTPRESSLGPGAYNPWASRNAAPVLSYALFMELKATVAGAVPDAPLGAVPDAPLGGRRRLRRSHP